MNKLLLAALASILFSPMVSTAAPMPEFGNSVQFDKAGPAIAMSRLRGKAVLVIFFQSWCGICNGWSGNMLKQVEAAHGSNRAVVLVAIKTDGGGLSGAKDYLKAKGADLTKWCVGSDSDATFYKQVTGKNELWTYVLVGATGDIVERNEAGRHWRDGPEKGKFCLASQDLLKPCGKLETVLPAGKKYPPQSDKIARLAELGNLGKAFSLCGAADQAEIKQDLTNIVETRLKQGMDTLKDATKSGPSRYDAYQDLALLTKECPSAPGAREAGSMLVKANGAPVIQNEKNAEAAYLALAEKLRKSNPREHPKLLADMALLAKRYEGTKYGQIAGEAAKAAPRVSPK